MNIEKGIEVSYQLTPEVMKVGVAASYDDRFKVRKWITWGLAGFLICIGIFLLQSKRGTAPFLSVFFIFMGITYLFNKWFYVRRSVKGVFAGRGKEINVRFTARDDGYELNTDSDESRSQWKSIVKYLFVDAGVLLYPQKNIFYFIPVAHVEITGGTWDELTAMIQRNVDVTVK